jgi:hypothetical protein
VPETPQIREITSLRNSLIDRYLKYLFNNALHFGTDVALLVLTLQKGYPIMKKTTSSLTTGIPRMKTTTAAKILALTLMLTLSGIAQANIIELGQINLTGNFTLNHSYDFNHPEASPFGAFGAQTVQNATGIFAPYVSAGDTLGVNTPFMSLPMIWSIGGFTLSTQYFLIVGPDSGRFCFGATDLSGNGFDPNDYPPFGAFSHWTFTAPPYDISNFDEDVTGPITLQIAAGYDNGHVPDTATTLGFLAVGLFGLLCTRRLVLLSESRERRKTGY